MAKCNVLLFEPHALKKLEAACPEKTNEFESDRLTLTAYRNENDLSQKKGQNYGVSEIISDINQCSVGCQVPSPVVHAISWNHNHNHLASWKGLKKPYAYS